MSFERYISQQGRSKGHPNRISVSMCRITFPAGLLREHNPNGLDRVALFFDKANNAIAFRFTKEGTDSYKMNGTTSKIIEPFPFWRVVGGRDPWQGTHEVKVLTDKRFGKLLVITLEGSAKTE